jgi:hypothetical protein
MSTRTDPDIVTAMRSAYLDDAHGAAKELVRLADRLAGTLEDLGDLKCSDRDELEAELLLDRAAAIATAYERFTRAVDAVRDTTEEE